MQNDRPAGKHNTHLPGNRTVDVLMEDYQGHNRGQLCSELTNRVCETIALIQVDVTRIDAGMD